MPLQPFADGRLPLDEIPAANGNAEFNDQPDCTVCGKPDREDNSVAQWFDPEADRYVAACARCAEAEGYRHSA